MARTIKSIVKNTLDESEKQILELMTIYKIKLPFEKVKHRMQVLLERELRKFNKNRHKKQK